MSAHNDTEFIEEVTQLTALFPDIERDVLATMLKHHGSIERLVAVLLDDVNFEGFTEDAAAALSLQAGLDEELAIAIQQELNQARASQPTNSAGESAIAGQTVGATVASGTKRLLQPLQERLRRLSIKSRGSHGQRLLDDSTPAPNYDESLEPLQPLYSPPAPQILTPTALPTMPATATISSTRIDGDASGAASVESSSTKQYTSRVERARVANRAKSLSVAQPLPSSLAPITASQNVPSPVIPPLAHGPVEVPVGELI